MQELLERHRRNLHRIPEIGFDLPKTQAYLRAQLAPMKARVEEVAQCGLIAYFDAGRERTVAFRSDMDALEIQEPAGCAFASQHPGRMHACGHDAHMAMLLALGQWLSENAKNLARNVLLIFQPAEESGGGARHVVDSGVLERYRVERIFAAHVQPNLDAGVISTRPGAFAATASEIHIQLQGRSTHAARAREGRDALEAGVKVVRCIDSFERALGADVPHLLKICSFHAGTATNIIAGEARLEGTVRSFDREHQAYLIQSIRQIVRDACAPARVVAQTEFSQGYPPVVNDPELYRLLVGALEGAAFVPMAEPDLIAEDFSYYQERVPGLMFYLGLGTRQPLHSPDFHLDESALIAGVNLFERLAMLAD